MPTHQSQLHKAVRTTYFIVALILISETLFRLFPHKTYEQEKDSPTPTYDFFLFSDVRLHTETYVYFLFEYAKVLGFVTILYVVNTRWRFLFWLFGIDLVTFLLNYDNTWGYFYRLPIGADTVKLTIFGGVIIREALTHYHGQHPDLGQRRNFISHVAGNLSKAIRVFSRKTILHAGKAVLFRINDRSKIEAHESE